MLIIVFVDNFNWRKRLLSSFFREKMKGYEYIRKALYIYIYSALRMYSYPFIFSRFMLLPYV